MAQAPDQWRRRGGMRMNRPASSKARAPAAEGWTGMNARAGKVGIMRGRYAGEAGARIWKRGKAMQITVICKPDRWRIAEYPGLIPEKRAPSVLYYRALVPPDGSCIPTLRRHAFTPAHREEGRQTVVSPAGLQAARLPAARNRWPAGKRNVARAAGVYRETVAGVASLA